jgi:succinate-semialdehyde dehydrogenase/glutarate-semialdehyde dehydrogenase
VTTSIVQAMARAWEQVRATGRIQIADPADGTVLYQAPIEDPAAAVARARTAGKDWAGTPAAARGKALHAAADAIAARTDDLAYLVHREMGKPLDDARAGVEAGIGTLRQYAELGPVHRGRSLAGEPGATDFMAYEPRGVVAAITPWNDPVAVACGLIGAAVVTGNTVVHKPSERTPGTGWLLGQLFAEALPEGVCVTVTGDGGTGAALAAQPVDVVAHVGSTATGRAIRRAALDTGAKVLLENGGNDPLVVDAGVDPQWAASQAALGAFANAGQICVSVERVYVHESVADAFAEALVAEALRMEIGPLVDRRMREAVHAHVSAAVSDGAKLHCGGEIPDGPGSYYPPTVLTGCTQEMAVMREETFGPVAPVATVDSFDTALAMASEGEYGLAATVLTRDMAHAQLAWRRLPAGTVKINNVFGGAPGGAAQPRGASGQGFGYGPELLDELTHTKVVHWSV